MAQLPLINIRPFQASDASFLVDYLNEPEVTQYITNAIPKPYTADDAKCWIENSQGNRLVNAITYQEQFVGCIAATPGNYEYSRNAELGYWVAKDYWKKGIMTKAVEAFIKQLLTHTQLSRFTVSVVTENVASIKVLEKNGFVREGTMKRASCKNGEFFDEYLYAFIK